VTTDAWARPIAARYPTRFLRAYVRSKIRLDPVYDAVFERIRGSDEPLFDIGCGIGILALYLRARGVRAGIRGVDHDERKIAIARSVMPDGTFDVADARTANHTRGTIVLIDLLHYFHGEEQARILANAAANANTVIIRDAIRDGSWRYRITYMQEMFARALRWLRADLLHFPTREDVIRPFVGFHVDVVPLHGRTPFNNYLFVFRRSTEGITNE
jgi:SAM-dependent methyltransferase